MKEISQQPKKQKEEFDPIACMKELLPNVKIAKFNDVTEAVLVYKHTSTAIAYFSRSRNCVGFAPKLVIYKDTDFLTKQYEYRIITRNHDNSFLFEEDFEQISIRYPDAIKARMKKLAKQVKESFIELAKMEMQEDF